MSCLIGKSTVSGSDNLCYNPGKVSYEGLHKIWNISFQIQGSVLIQFWSCNCFDISPTVNSPKWLTLNLLSCTHNVIQVGQICAACCKNKNTCILLVCYLKSEIFQKNCSLNPELDNRKLFLMLTSCKSYKNYWYVKR